MAEPKRQPRRRPATTPEGFDNQMISLAYEVAEEQMRNRTASAQVITHYLRMGSPRERLEQERIRHENELLQAKVESMHSGKRMEEVYTKALNAMRRYQGQEVEDEFQ